MQTDIVKLNESLRNLQSVGMFFRRSEFNLSGEHFKQPEEKIPKTPFVRRVEMHSHSAAIKDPGRLQRELREVDRDSFGNFIDRTSV